MNPILLTLFFLSGICGLIYEVVWTRMLTLVMGNTVFATSTVLAAFMGGLALGSSVFGRMVDRSGSPLKFYGLLELLLGIYCLILPFLLQGMLPVYRFLYRPFGSDPKLLTLAQFLFSGLLILFPSALMGGTLPALSRSMVRSLDQVGRSVGRLYAINSSGAVVGALAAGFLLLPTVGVRASLYGAAGVNILIGLASIVLQGRISSARPPDGAAAEPRRKRNREGDRGPRLVLIALLISGAAALIYEVAWTRVLALLLGPSVQAFSLMLAAFIAGLALGSWMFSRLADREEDLLALFALAQFGVAFSAAAFVPMVGLFPPLIRNVLRGATESPLRGYLLNTALIFPVMLIPTTLLGAVFPLAVKLYSRSLPLLGTELGTLYSVNTAGAVIGSLSAGFLLIPFLGLQTTILAASWINVSVGSALLFGSRPGGSRVRLALIAMPAGALVAFLYLPKWDAMQLSSGPYLYLYNDEADASRVLGREEILYYREGVTGTVAVKQRNRERFLVISGKVDAGSLPADMITQALLGRIPLSLARDPEDILVIGLGSGVTLGEVARYPVKRIDSVEISYEVREAASLFSHINHDVLKDERINLVIQDARNFLLFNDRKYDLIISEPSNPWMAGIGNLYTREFFSLARGRLKAGGLMGQWIGAYNIPTPYLKSIVRTFSEVFPHVSLWTLSPSDLLLIGSMAPLPADAKEVRKYLLVEGLILKEGAQDAPIHTDDHPFLEFELPKAMRTDTWPSNDAWIGGLRGKAIHPATAPLPG